MKKIGFYLRKYWYAYALALLGLLLYEVLDMISPYVTRRIIDDVIGKSEFNLLGRLLLILLGVAVGRVVFGYLREFLFDKYSFTIASDIRKHLFKHIQGLSIDYFDGANTGELMARIKDDVDRVQAAFGFIGMLILQVILHTIMVVYCMIKLSPKLTIIPLIAIPVCGSLAIVLEKKLDKVYDDISEENAKMNTTAEENLAGVRVVKAFAREKFEISKFLSHNKKYYELNMKQSKVWIKYYPIFQVVGKILPVISILWGGSMVIKGDITLGTLGAFIEYCNNAIWPMEMLGWLSNELASAFASKKKLDKIYKETATITAPESLSPSEADRFDKFHSFEFDHVSLTIGDKEILKDVSFTLKNGETLGIMGATGAGKTSVINLLMRFYDPTEGVIKLNGVDIRELPFETVRRMTATVMQEVFLFSDTIRENIRFGRKNETEDEAITRALEASCADEFVSKYEEGADTIIGERGVGLSGGQKQRISMARAFAKNAPVLVLDDSTSALDMETEQQVQKNLKEFGNTSKVIIAHRISAVRHANEIIIIENGQISERGNHESLMEQKGYYYKTYMAQYGELMPA